MAQLRNSHEIPKRERPQSCRERKGLFSHRHLQAPLMLGAPNRGNRHGAARLRRAFKRLETRPMPTVLFGVVVFFFFFIFSTSERRSETCPYVPRRSPPLRKIKTERETTAKGRFSNIQRNFLTRFVPQSGIPEGRADGTPNSDLQ